MKSRASIALAFAVLFWGGKSHAAISVASSTFSPASNYEIANIFSPVMSIFVPPSTTGCATFYVEGSYTGAVGPFTIGGQFSEQWEMTNPSGSPVGGTYIQTWAPVDGYTTQEGPGTTSGSPVISFGFSQQFCGISHSGETISLAWKSSGPNAANDEAFIAGNPAGDPDGQKWTISVITNG